MKICICTTGPDLNSRVSTVFGRCPYFLIVDSESKEFKAVSNPALQSGRGAGVRASQLVVSEGAMVVICGNFGPNAFSVLQMSGIKIYPEVFDLTAEQAINKYNKGELKEIKVSTTPDHFGLGRGRGLGMGRKGR